MKARLRRFVAGSDGAAALEFAIVATIFIFLSLGVIDFARNFHVQHRMAQIADRLARTLYLNQTMTVAALNATMVSLGGDGFTLALTDGTTNGVPVRVMTLTRDQDYVSPFLSDLRGRIRVIRTVPIPGPYF